jgi:hypothetical protein
MSTVLAVISTAAVVFTVAVYAVQARLLSKQTKLLAATNCAILASNIAERMFQLNALLLEKPEIRPFIYSDRPLPANNEHLREQALICGEMFLDFMDTTLANEVFSPTHEIASWHSYFRDIAKGSSAIRGHWKVAGRWYQPRMHNLLNPVIGAPDGEPDWNGKIKA